MKLKQNRGLRKCKGNECTDDNSGIQNVPQVTTVSTRMKYDALIDDLSGNK